MFLSNRTVNKYNLTDTGLIYLAKTILRSLFFCIFASEKHKFVLFKNAFIMKNRFFYKNSYIIKSRTLII